MANIYDVLGNTIMNNVTPEMYGAVGDGVANDTVAIQNAVRSGGTIVFGTEKRYKITSTIRIPKDTILELNGATLQYVTQDGTRIFVNFLETDTDFTGYNGNGNIIIRNGTIIGGNISFAHGENILLENVHFRNGLSPHFLEICACKNYRILNCSFIGVINSSLSVHEYINVDPAVYNAFPLIPRESPFFDGAKNDSIEISNCYFSVGVGDYAYGYNAFGVHGVAGNGINTNIKLTRNVLRGFTGCGFRINDMDNVLIEGNDIQVEGDGIRVGDVGQSTDVLIKGNVITASGTAITRANNSTVFQSSDNDINPTFSIIELQMPSLSMFQSIGIVGDSFASGAIYVGGSSQEYYPLSWGQIMARMVGATAVNYSKGGLTTKSWLTDATYGLAKLNSETANQLYIIALGINDGNQSIPIGTIADITSDNTDSFYSYYGRIVRAIQAHAPNAIIMLSTCARWTDKYEPYSTAIRAIGEYYSFPVLDLAESEFFQSSFFSDNQVSNHPTAINYSAMAKEYKRLIENALAENIGQYKTYIG